MNINNIILTFLIMVGITILGLVIAYFSVDDANRARPMSEMVSIEVNRVDNQSI